MSEVKFYGMIPVTIYEDEHEIHRHENYQKVVCPGRDEIYIVSSNKGSLEIYCPGCGIKLDRISK